MAEEGKGLTGQEVIEQYRKSDRRWTWGIWVSLGLAAVLAVAAWVGRSASLGCVWGRSRSSSLLSVSSRSVRS